jgi:hypothetical protein
MSSFFKRLPLILVMGLFLSSCGHLTLNKDEKIYVVQRERESLQESEAVIRENAEKYLSDMRSRL